MVHWVLTVETRHLLCYYVLSGRYSQRDIATYANRAPNSGTEEWLKGCSRPAGKQEPCTPADSRMDFGGQLQDYDKLVLNLGLTLLSRPAVDKKIFIISFLTEIEWDLGRTTWQDELLRVKKKKNLHSDSLRVASSKADTVFSPSPKLATPVHWVLR